MLSSLQIQPNDRTPMYIQLANALKEGITTRKLSREKKLPSINFLSAACDVSKDTVEKAYKILRKQELVEAIPGKGYFVKTAGKEQEIRIFLLFNKLSAHKKIVYEHFIETLGPNVEIDFHVYNNDFDIFQQLLQNCRQLYTHYVIIPHFNNHFHSAQKVINQIPKHQLVLLDKNIDGISGAYSCVYQDFEQDIQLALEEAQPHLKKYHTLKLLFPPNTYQPREIIKGFRDFCVKHQYRGRLVPDIEKEPIQAGEAYITMMDDDLVTLIKKIRHTRLAVGQEVGILSYNDNPLKEVLLDGISALSTDYANLGRRAAEMILNEETAHYKNPFRLILRNSL